jgi:hypothetical protein
MNAGDLLILERLDDGTLQVDVETGDIYSTKVLESRLGNQSGLFKLKGWYDPDGYLRIHIRNGKKSKSVAAHRIVWLSVNRDIPDNYLVDHINRDRTDNRLSNLRLLHISQNSDCGSKLGNWEIELIRGLYFTGDFKIMDLAFMFDVEKGVIWRAINERRSYVNPMLSVTYK